MMAKTRAALFPQVRDEVKKLHSYKVPEIILLPIAEGSADYLAWIKRRNFTYAVERVRRSCPCPGTTTQRLTVTGHWSRATVQHSAIKNPHLVKGGERTMIEEKVGEVMKFFAKPGVAAIKVTAVCWQLEIK